MSDKKIPAGHVAAFDGRPVLMKCMNCSYCSDGSDGYEYGPSFYICEKKGREQVSNLKSFPFKTHQEKCFELSYIFEVDWDAEGRKLNTQ